MTSVFANCISLLSQQMRPILKERNPGWDMADLSQELGHMRRGMSGVTRIPYAAHEEKMREIWHADSAKYNEEAGKKKSHLFKAALQSNLAIHQKVQKLLPFFEQNDG